MRLRVVPLLRLLLVFVAPVALEAAPAVPAACALSALALAGCTREPPGDVIPGVRLGMTPRDVRDRFEGGAEGSWQTRVGTGAGDDTVVEWTSKSETSRATQARFEFHLGMLVAIRASLRETIPAARIDLTEKTVTLRTPGPTGTDVTVLARDCPTHREEAESLAAKAPPK